MTMAIALPVQFSQRRSSHPGLVRHVATNQPHTAALTGSGGASLVIAGAQGALAYALLAPRWFAKVHPVWGGIFAVLSVLNLADAVG